MNPKLRAALATAPSAPHSGTIVLDFAPKDILVTLINLNRDKNGKHLTLPVPEVEKTERTPPPVIPDPTKRRT